MSSNRLAYDTCAYKTKIDSSVGVLQYHLNPMKYENCNKCRIELGVVGGSDVSHIKGNLVDLENDLRGQTRNLSNCPAFHYHPSAPVITKPTDGSEAMVINTNLIHLPSCQMFKYKPVPLPDPLEIEVCSQPHVASPNSCIMAPEDPECR